MSDHRRNIGGLIHGEGEAKPRLRNACSQQHEPSAIRFRGKAAALEQDTTACEASYSAQGMTGQGQAVGEILSVPGIPGGPEWLLQALELIPKSGIYPARRKRVEGFEVSCSCQGGKPGKLGRRIFGGTVTSILGRCVYLLVVYPGLWKSSWSRGLSCAIPHACDPHIRPSACLLSETDAVMSRPGRAGTLIFGKPLRPLGYPRIVPAPTILT